MWEYRDIPKCHKGARAFTFWYNYVYVGILVVLFANFFVKSYLSPSAAAKKKR